MKDARDNLANSNDKIRNLELELETQKQYYQDLLEKKSVLPVSFESLHTGAEEELSFVVDGSDKFVKTGSIQKLVDYLVDPTSSDTRFLQIFVFSFPMFMESKIFLKLVLSRLNQEKDSNDILKISRVMNILKYWIDHYFIDFETDSSLIGKLCAQLESLNSNTTGSISGMSQMILRLINKRVQVFSFYRIDDRLETRFSINVNFSTS